MQATPLIQTPLFSKKQSLRNTRKKMTEQELKEMHAANMQQAHVNKEKNLMS